MLIFTGPVKACMLVIACSCFFNSLDYLNCDCSSWSLVLFCLIAPSDVSMVVGFNFNLMVLACVFFFLSLVVVLNGFIYILLYIYVAICLQLEP